MFVISISLAALLVCCYVGVATSARTCFDDAECSYNGHCQRGKCHCRPAWKGADCGVLNTKAAPTNSGFRPNAQGFLNSWGGSPIRIPGVGNSTSTYALFAAGFENGCQLGDWIPNSAILRTTSSNPLGPFDATDFDVVVPTFAHNPEVTPLKSGGYAMFFIGRNNSHVKNCSSNSSGQSADLSDKRQWETKRQHDSMVAPGIACEMRSEACIRRAFSGDAGKHWTELPGVALNGNLSSWDVDASNPGPRESRDGSTFFMAYRAAEYRTLPNSTSHWDVLQLGMSSAPFWNSTTFRRTSDSVSKSIFPETLAEDPTIWQDEDNRWHMLTHWFKDLTPGNLPPLSNPNPSVRCSSHSGSWPFGLHAFSKDGVSWKHSAEAAYDCRINQEDGSMLTVVRRERPKVLLSKGNYGDPIVLYNGVQSANNRSFTHAQPVHH